MSTCKVQGAGERAREGSERAMFTVVLCSVSFVSCVQACGMQHMRHGKRYLHMYVCMYVYIYISLSLSARDTASNNCSLHGPGVCSQSENSTKGFLPGGKSRRSGPGCLPKVQSHKSGFRA